jgi:hypothetical protein
MYVCMYVCIYLLDQHRDPDRHVLLQFEHMDSDSFERDGTALTCFLGYKLSFPCL